MKRAPQPVIAATKVKPPTAAMKSKASRPIQRYAPPPRLSGTEPSSHPPPVGAFPTPPQPTGTGAMPPTRGRGAPPVRGRGAPPMGRGGHVPPPVHGAGTNLIPTGTPPPPKIGSRGRPSQS